MPLTQILANIVAELPAGKLGVYVKDLLSGEETGVRADERFPLASVLKVPVLVEFFRQVREGLIRLDERMELTDLRKTPGSGILQELDAGLRLTMRDLATLMIIRSDNAATDMVLERVGLANVNAALDRLGLRQTRVTMDVRTLLYNSVGLAWPGHPPGPELAKEYERRSESGERDRYAIAYSDSLENDVGTPRELGQLLELICKGEAFDRESSRRALEILQRQQINDRLPRFLPPETVVAHKTGSLWGVRNDVGIVHMPHGPVIVACLSSGCADYGEEAATAIARVGRAVWDYYTRSLSEL